MAHRSPNDYQPSNFYPSCPSAQSKPLAPSVAYSQMQQNNPFSYGAYAGFWSTNQAFANYHTQPRSSPYLTQSHNYGRQGMYDNNGEYFVEEHQSQLIKSERRWSGPANLPFDSANTSKVPISTHSGNETNFGTEVDTLMKAIQAKTQTTTPQKPSSAEQSRPMVGASRTPPSVKASSQASESIQAHAVECSGRG